jgi:DNA-binding CsgD family transcriptional regulator
MTNELNAQLDSAFRNADEARAKVELLKQLAHMDPVRTAKFIINDIPEQRKRTRKEIAASFGVDISDDEGLQGRYSCFSVEVVVVHQAWNLYRALGEFQQHIEAVVADTLLTEKARAARICELGVEILHMQEANFLHTLHEINKLAASSSDERARRHSQEALASRLAGHLATRISTQRNSRLRKALDEIREHNKPAKRERFEALLRELFAYSPTIWADYHNDDLSLRVTRNAVVRRIEKHEAPRSPESELTTFAAREAALKIARTAGLTPRERELFKFFVENPKAKNGEAARALGIAEGTVRSLKSKIKKALDAA